LHDFLVLFQRCLESTKSKIVFQSLLHASTVIKSKVHKNIQLMLQFILVGFLSQHGAASGSTELILFYGFLIFKAELRQEGRRQSVS